MLDMRLLYSCVGWWWFVYKKVFHPYFFVTCNFLQSGDNFTKCLKLNRFRRIFFTSEVINGLLANTRHLSKFIPSYIVLFKKFIKCKFWFHILSLEHFIRCGQIVRCSQLDIGKASLVYLKELKLAFFAKSTPALRKDIPLWTM